jgi:hypothetical protein
MYNAASINSYNQTKHLIFGFVLEAGRASALAGRIA